MGPFCLPVAEVEKWSPRDAHKKIVFVEPRALNLRLDGIVGVPAQDPHVVQHLRSKDGKAFLVEDVVFGNVPDDKLKVLPINLEKASLIKFAADVKIDAIFKQAIRWANQGIRLRLCAWGGVYFDQGTPAHVMQQAEALGGAVQAVLRAAPEGAFTVVMKSPALKFTKDIVTQILRQLEWKDFGVQWIGGNGFGGFITKDVTEYDGAVINGLIDISVTSSWPRRTPTNQGPVVEDTGGLIE